MSALPSCSPEPADPPVIDGSAVPPEFEEVIDKLPPEHREEVMQMVRLSYSAMTRTSPEGEIAKKITPELIEKQMDYRDKQGEREHKDKHENRIIYLIAFGLGIIAIVIVIAMLKDKPELLQTVIASLVSFAGGGLGGYGIAKRKSDE